MKVVASARFWCSVISTTCPSLLTGRGLAASGPGLAALRDEWAARLAAYRTAAGLRPLPRADSATARLLALLPEAPVVTPTTLGRVLGVSLPAAGAALDEVHRAGILSRRKIARGATAYLSREILDLVTGTERALASTRFDTRLSPPHAGAPARPTP